MSATTTRWCPRSSWTAGGRSPAWRYRAAPITTSPSSTHSIPGLTTRGSPLARMCSTPPTSSTASHTAWSSEAAAMSDLRAAGADTTTPAVVLKFDQNVMHHGGLGALRSLGRLGVPVYGVHEGPWAPAAACRYLRGRWFWRPDADDAERTTAGLLALAERIGRPAVLIPTDDAGAIFLAEHGASLREAFRFPAPPPGLPRRVAGKATLRELCGEAGMPCPAAARPASLEEARSFAAAVGYPVIAKLAEPWAAMGSGLRSTSVARDA